MAPAPLLKVAGAPVGCWPLRRRIERVPDWLLRSSQTDDFDCQNRTCADALRPHDATRTRLAITCREPDWRRFAQEGPKVNRIICVANAPHGIRHSGSNPSAVTKDFEAS